MKYELLEETLEQNVFNERLYSACRIRSIESFGNVKEGDLGGFVESAANLDKYGRSWAYGDARVVSEARVYGNARVMENAVIADRREGFW